MFIFVFNCIVLAAIMVCIKHDDDDNIKIACMPQWVQELVAVDDPSFLLPILTLLCPRCLVLSCDAFTLSSPCGPERSPSPAKLFMHF